MNLAPRTMTEDNGSPPHQVFNNANSFTHRVFRPELEVALGEVRHHVHHLLNWEVAYFLSAYRQERGKRQQRNTVLPVQSLLRSTEGLSEHEINQLNLTTFDTIVSSRAFGIPSVDAA